MARLTTIAAASGTEFVVGTEDGLVLLCSSVRAAGVDSNNWIDPVVSELQPHQFAVSSLNYNKSGQRMVLMSCDVSGEVLIRMSSEVMISTWMPISMTKLFTVSQQDFTSQWQVLKMPIKLRNSIACTSDSEFLLAADDDGGLELIS